MKRYKFLLEGNKSKYGDHKWRKNKWYTYDGELELCERGFHCSKGIYQAFSFVQGEILAEVEVKGNHLEDTNKEVWESMRVVKRYKWTKKDSVLFAIYAARLCLENFEKVFPNDKRPREAVEAAKKYVKNPTEKNRSVAARAAWAAESAASAAESAAAWAAARAAARAAESAASAAASAAESAAWAAARAAESAIYKKLDKWMLNHLKGLKEI